MRHIALTCGLAAIAATAHAQNIGIKLTHGVDGYVEVPAAPALIPYGGVTLEAWITYDDATLQSGWSFPTVARQNLAAQSETFFLRVEAGQTSARVLRWKVVTSNGGQPAAAYTFTPGQLLTWTHVAGTYDGQTARLFVNGVEVASTPGTGPLRNQGGTLRIGKGDDATSNNEVWNGEIDEVRLWPYARTAAEILATMNVELVGIPGKVSTWNLTGFSLDTSGGLHGTVNGTVTYQPNSLMLRLPTSSGITAFGGGTNGCRGEVGSTVTSLPFVGNGAFGVAGTLGPLNGGGALLLATGQLASALPFLGVDFWIDPARYVLAINATTNALGTSRVTLPIANDPTLTGLRIDTQYLWLDACGSQGLTASKGTQFTVVQ